MNEPTLDDYNALLEKHGRLVEESNRARREYEEKLGNVQIELDLANGQIEQLLTRQMNPLTRAHRAVCRTLDKIGTGYKTKLLAAVTAFMTTGNIAALKGQIPFVPADVQVAISDFLLQSSWGYLALYAILGYLTWASYDARNYRSES